MASQQQQQPSPEQLAQMQQQFAAEAARRGMTPQQFGEMQRQALVREASAKGLKVEDYINEIKANAMRQHQAQQQALQQQQARQQGGGGPTAGQQQQQPQQQQIPINASGTPRPEALAVAKFLKSQDLKPRTCILDGQRRDMFKVKRALRALQSPAYQKAQSKAKSNLPPVTDLPTAENAFKLLPLNMLALRVSKSDPHAGHDHAPAKPQKNRVKGLWTVQIEKQQDTDPMLHYAWFYEGPQWKQKAYAVGAVAIIMTIVMFPLWPVTLRIGVWYLSMGLLGLLGLFFLMAIFRLILFCVTVFTVPPGLWLFPNLFEDVGVIDSFKPLWGWQETKKKKSKPTIGKAESTKSDAMDKSATVAESAPPTTTNAASTTATPAPTAPPTKRNLSARVEDEEDE